MVLSCRNTNLDLGWLTDCRPLAGTLVAIHLILCLFTQSASAAPNYPELTGRIVDGAGLLSSADQAQIEAELSDLENTSTDQLTVVTVKSLDGYAIEDYANGLARKWGIGQKGKDNGIVLLIAPNERKVRIEVGRRLEPMLTDTMSKLIIQNAILPGFRRGDFAAGIRAGVRDIKDVVLGDAEAVRKRARGRKRGHDLEAQEVMIFAIWLAIFIYIMWQQHRQAQRMGKGATRRRMDDGSIIIIPSGHHDHWGGGWSGGGGGWSGGGGGFGGGGASGSW